MTFKVTKQFGGGRELPPQQFTDLASAKKHALEGAEENARMKIDAIYRIYDSYDDVVETYNTKSLPTNPEVMVDDEAQGGGKSQGATFKPTPFEMAPRPKGTPPKWIIDPEEDKDKDK